MVLILLNILFSNQMKLLKAGQLKFNREIPPKRYLLNKYIHIKYQLNDITDMFICIYTHYSTEQDKPP